MSLWQLVSDTLSTHWLPLDPSLPVAGTWPYKPQRLQPHSQRSYRHRHIHRGTNIPIHTHVHAQLAGSLLVPQLPLPCGLTLRCVHTYKHHWVLSLATLRPHGSSSGWLRFLWSVWLPASPVVSSLQTHTPPWLPDHLTYLLNSSACSLPVLTHSRTCTAAGASTQAHGPPNHGLAAVAGT